MTYPRHTSTATLAILLITIPWISCGSAGTSAYGSCLAWICTDRIHWSPATTYPRLHPGDTFQVLLKITPSTPMNAVFLKLHEFGTPVYEVINGPTPINVIMSCGAIRPNTTKPYLWTIRILPDTRWINGTAPLEVFTQFSKTDTDASVVSFDALYAFIEPALTKGTTRTTNQTTQPVPASAIKPQIVFLCLWLTLLLFVTRHHHHRL